MPRLVQSACLPRRWRWPVLSESRLRAQTSGQVIVFDWAISRGVRRRVDGPMEELGPGVDLVSVDARAVPSDVIQRVDGVAFAIKIPKAVYDPSAERLIDVDHTALRFKLVLR